MFAAAEDVSSRCELAIFQAISPPLPPDIFAARQLDCRGWPLLILMLAAFLPDATIAIPALPSRKCRSRAGQSVQTANEGVTPTVRRKRRCRRVAARNILNDFFQHRRPHVAPGAFYRCAQRLSHCWLTPNALSAIFDSYALFSAPPMPLRSLFFATARIIFARRRRHSAFRQFSRRCSSAALCQRQAAPPGERYVRALKDAAPIVAAAAAVPFSCPPPA